MSIHEVSIEKLESALASGSRVIDVREQHEYDEAHVPGAQFVALSTLPDHIDAFRGETPAYVICRSGGRSLQACEYLADHNIEAVNVAGGTLAWVTSGKPTVTGPNPT